MRLQKVRSMSTLLDASEDGWVDGTPAEHSSWTWRAWIRRRGVGAGALTTMILLLICAVGLVLGFALPTSDDLHGPYRRISSVIGWTYFCCWSVSFYPQVLLNFRRKTSVGLSFDYLVYNVLAFSCYSAFTCSLFWSKAVQRAYDKRHEGQTSKVRLNDVFFTLHAAAISIVTIGQVVYYDWRARRQRPSSAAVITCVVIILICVVYALAVEIAQAARGQGVWDVSGDEMAVLNWLDFLYFLSYVKASVAVSIVKYIPQVVLNLKRRSTKGWAMWNVLLDLMGGLLSILQLVLDCWNTGDWGGISGYPVKFAIGFVSVFFDLIFMFQHYVLYPYPRHRDSVLISQAPSAPLLPGGNVQEDGATGGEAWFVGEGAGAAGARVE
ncbi:unnamed protein product [Ascophyllum nodosum]